MSVPITPPPTDRSCAVPTDLRRLTQGLVDGADAAYRDFHATYYPRLFRYLLAASGGNEARAKDALQQTYLRVTRHVRVFEEEAVFWRWLTVVARTALADENRKERRYLSFLDRFWRTDAAAPPASPAPLEQLEAALQHALGTLANEDRWIIEAKYLQRRPVRAIAEELGTTEKAVESRLTRIRQRLRKLLLDPRDHGLH